MTVVNATTLRNNLADTLDEVRRKKYMLVARRGKLISAVVDIDFFEDLIELADTKYRESIRKARKEYNTGNVYTHEEVFGEL